MRCGCSISMGSCRCDPSASDDLMAVQRPSSCLEVIDCYFVSQYSCAPPVSCTGAELYTGSLRSVRGLDTSSSVAGTRRRREGRDLTRICERWLNPSEQSGGSAHTRTVRLFQVFRIQIAGSAA